MIAPVIPTVLRVMIPGVPVAQGRGRAVRFGNSVRVIDPASSRSWKGAAQVHMLAARQKANVFAASLEPVAILVVALWPRPKSLPKWKGEYRYCRASRPDADNILKAVMDAGNGVLWQDDSQVVRAVVEKWVCGSGEEPCVVVGVQSAALDAARGQRV